MARATLRPATSADVRHFAGSIPLRCELALAGEDETGALIGVGGVAVLPDGRRMAFTELTEEARRHPVALHKAALRVLHEARAAGVRELVATTDIGRTPAGERWLKRLGFERAEAAGGTCWTWKNDDLS